MSLSDYHFIVSELDCFDLFFGRFCSQRGTLPISFTSKSGAGNAPTLPPITPPNPTFPTWKAYQTPTTSTTSSSSTPTKFPTTSMSARTTTGCRQVRSCDVERQNRFLATRFAKRRWCHFIKLLSLRRHKIALRTCRYYSPARIPYWESLQVRVLLTGCTAGL